MNGKYRKLYIFALFLTINAIIVITILAMLGPTEGIIMSQIVR